MRRWGEILLIVGFSAFLLPMLGLRWRGVDDMLGAEAQPLLGVLCVVVGAALFTVARKRERLGTAKAALHAAAALAATDMGIDRDRLQVITALFQRHEFALAEPLLREYLEDHPGNAAAWALLARAQIELQRLGEAEQAGRRVLELDWDSPQGHNILGNIHRLRGRHGEAQACHAHALRVAPDDATAWSGLSLVEQARGNAQRALELAEKAFALDKTNSQAASHLALLYHDCARQTEAAHMREVARRLGYRHMEDLDRALQAPGRAGAQIS